jgi:hypothetical protein
MHAKGLVLNYIYNLPEIRGVCSNMLVSQLIVA